MRKAPRLVGLVAIAWASFLSVSALPATASAAPGTCKCNSGCHANPGQCVKGAACNVGYAATCGYRTGAAACPMVGYISCDGTCACTPIPGFCDTIGGAEYCDSGVKDTGPPDTFVPDTFVPDTFVPDTFVPDTFVPDTFVPDTFVPDTFVPPTDTCVPLECPPMTKTIGLPGECDPYCAPAAGGGEFKCSVYPGTVLVDGFCVPKCLTVGNTCADCQRCSLGDGKCFDDLTACDGGVPDGFEGGTTLDGSAADGTVVTDSADDVPISFDTGTAGDDGGTSADGSVGADTGDPFGPPADGDVTTFTQGGCGCALPGSSTDGALVALAAAVAAGIVVARRRRDG
jgi:MYXO-CTERM domain-containing protein